MLRVIALAASLALLATQANAGNCIAEFYCKKGGNPASTIIGDGDNRYIAISSAEENVIGSGFNQVRDCGNVQVTCTGKNTKFKPTRGNE